MTRIAFQPMLLLCLLNACNRLFIKSSSLIFLFRVYILFFAFVPQVLQSFQVIQWFQVVLLHLESFDCGRVGAVGGLQGLSWFDYFGRIQLRDVVILKNELV